MSIRWRGVQTLLGSTIIASHCLMVVCETKAGHDTLGITPEEGEPPLLPTS